METENNTPLKLNSDKELTVDIKNIEDLLNSIKYATIQMEKAKEALISDELDRDFSYIKSRLDDVLDKQIHLREVVFENFEKDVKKSLNTSFSTLPKEDTLKTLVFELNRFNKVDALLSKLNLKNTIISSIVTTVLVVGALAYTKYDDKIFANYITSQIKANNYVLAKSQFEITKNNQYSVEFRKKETQK